MPKVLIADDDRTSCKLLGGLLIRWGYEAEIVHNGNDALRELLKPDAPQLAILDWMMPGLDGTEVIGRLRLAQRGSYTYIMLLTAKAQREDLLRGFDAGADDYVKKPFDAQELKARLRVGVRIIGLEHRLAGAMETAGFRATHDPLTGLYNRTAIVEVLKREASRCHRAGHPVSILIVAIDQFHAVVGAHGPKAGDQLIQQLAPKMSSDMRPHDSVGRVGREKFMIVAPNCTLKHGLVVADRVRLAVAKENFRIHQLKLALSASIGVSTVTEGDPEINQALQNADFALYQSKRGITDSVVRDVTGEAEAEPLQPVKVGADNSTLRTGQGL